MTYSGKTAIWYNVIRSIYMYKFSLRSGMSVAFKTVVEMLIRLLMVRFALFHQLELYAAIGAIAQVHLLTT